MKKYDWDRSFYGVGVVYEPKVVRVANDLVLKKYLGLNGRRNSIRLAKYILNKYEHIYNKPLKITVKSLAAEIFNHFKLMDLSYRIENKVGKLRCTRWMIYHMIVIDCGERDVDNNRFIWDDLSIIW